MWERRLGHDLALLWVGFLYSFLCLLLLFWLWWQNGSVCGCEWGKAHGWWLMRVCMWEADMQQACLLCWGSIIMTVCNDETNDSNDSDRLCNLFCVCVETTSLPGYCLWEKMRRVCDQRKRSLPIPISLPLPPPIPYPHLMTMKWKHVCILTGREEGCCGIDNVSSIQYEEEGKWNIYTICILLRLSDSLCLLLYLMCGDCIFNGNEGKCPFYYYGLLSYMGERRSVY